MAPLSGGRSSSLDEAIDEARRRVARFGARTGCPTISVFREHTPDQRVNARIEITGPGLIRSPEGGIDVMGDGQAIAYTGAIRKEPIEADSLEQAFELLRSALDALRAAE